MLAVVGMLIYRTRDPSMWRWMADDIPESKPGLRSSAVKDEALVAIPKEELRETLVRGPNDLQPFEQSQAEYLFQAVTDREPCSAEEMPAYWKLMRWSMTQSFDDLWDRANSDRYFTHLAEDPDKHRGELIALKPSLRRFVPHQEVPKNSAGAKEIYEVWGVTDESRTGLYCMVFYDKPPELPVTPNIHEEALFVGYFLKLISYEDALGVKRWAPLMIGRLKWRENSARVAMRQQRTSGDMWQWLIIGGALVVLGVAWVWTRPSARQLAANQVIPDHTGIEQWLASGAPEGQTANDDEATNCLRSWDEVSDLESDRKSPVGDVPTGRAS